MSMTHEFTCEESVEVAERLQMLGDSLKAFIDRTGISQRDFLTMMQGLIAHNEQMTLAICMVLDHGKLIRENGESRLDLMIDAIKAVGRAPDYRRELH